MSDGAADSLGRTAEELVRLAAGRLRREVWDYLSGGAESEATIAANRAAIERMGFVPRVLRDVSRVEERTVLLGRPLALPVFLAPIGSLALLHPGGAPAAARAAAASGTTAFVSLMAEPGPEAIAREAPGLVLQVYMRGDRAWLRDLVARAEAAGYAAVCLTVDSAVYGRRERDLINRYSSSMAADRAHLGAGGGAQITAHQSGLTWDMVAALRGMTRLPLVLKGIASPADAALAVEAGMDAVYVSNHGGRQLDFTLGALDLLPPVVEAVAGRAEVLVDGGFLRGTDILKALCLGARAVGLGKLQGWALAAGGEAGLRHLLALLAEEIRTAMALLGCARLPDLSPALLRSLPAPFMPGPLSAFRGLREGQGLNAEG
ncbi:alpha-hydroxy acid oxidase [Roseomonas populi]|uniref:Alpha-hydroxy-acid oxidizing protein n=1 Tax=Roseomonas populi TaxID=3121582 RepID=A0ABT1X6Q8_9PROT|nr:alpha-hydroxy acid oxidase [Roseomonas pecuniae]MCR0983773.1 alpha-hydroxy-acid oxidizing protein [Roseomonas pecuniae]